MTCNLKNNSSLHESIKTFNLDAVQRAFKTDPSSLNMLDPNIGWSTVYKAVVYEQYDIVKFLLEKGADPNLANKIGETPLHYAAEVGKEEFVRILLDYDANPNTKQSDGNTPFHIACKNDFSHIVKLMLRKQVDLNVQNKLGRTALHLVWQNSNIELYNLLIEYGADPDIKDKLGRKPQFINSHRDPEVKKAHPEPSVLSITNSSRSSLRDETNDTSDDKENNQNQAPRKSTRRKLSLGRPKDTKQRMSIGGGLQGLVKHPSEPRERILGDITNVMSLQHLKKPQIQLSHHDEENKPLQLTNNTQTPRLLAIKNQVLKTLDIHPLTLQKAHSQNISNTTPLQSPANSITNQAKPTIKERMEALKQSCSNLAKHQPRKSVSEHTFNSQNIDADLSSEDTQSTKSHQTQDGKPWLNSVVNSNNNLDAKPLQTESPSSPAPQQNDNHHLITPRLIQKEILTISAGKIFNNKLINIFCPTSPTSPKREDDFEFRRTESVYEINPLELQLHTEVRMSDWLADLGLQDLRLNFVDNGYTSFDKFKRDYDDCKVILKDLLYRFGVDKIGHRCRIVMKLREESGQLTRRGLFRFNNIFHQNKRLEFPKVKEWLSSLGYEEYLESFLDNGFDDLEYMVLQTYFKEVVLDEFMMRDEIGIKNKQIRDDILKRLRHVYEIAIGMDPSNFDSDIFLNLLCNKDSDSNKNCNIF